MVNFRHKRSNKNNRLHDVMYCFPHGYFCFHDIVFNIYLVVQSTDKYLAKIKCHKTRDYVDNCDWYLSTIGKYIKYLTILQAK